MSLTKNDLQSIRVIVTEVVDIRVSKVDKRIDSVDKRIDLLRIEMHDAFRKQGEHVSKSIAGAVKLISHSQEEELEKVYDRT